MVDKKDKEAQKQENNAANDGKEAAKTNKNNTPKVAKSDGIGFGTRFVIILILLALSGIYFYKNDIIAMIEEKLPSHDNVIENKPNDDGLYANFEAEIEINARNFQRLSANLKTLEREIQYNSEYIKSLQSKIDELEGKIKEININPQRVELIKTALNIQNDIRDGKNYSTSLETLKILSKNDVELDKKIDILKQNQNNIPNASTIKNTFDLELKNFLKENNVLAQNGKSFSKFLSNFVTVRKVRGIEENSTDFFIITLEKSIQEHNYSGAMDIFNNNPELDKYFPKTIADIRAKILVDDTAKEIINYLINK